MATQLPVPIRFRLPDGWVAKDPDEMGEPEMAFVAGHPASIENGSVAVITINGKLRSDPASMIEIADETANAFRRVSPDLQVVERREVGSPQAPGVTQVLKLTVDRNGTRQPLIQTQMLLAFVDVAEARKRAVVKFALTTTPNQFDTLIGDFQQLIGSIRPGHAGPGEAGQADPGQPEAQG